MSDASVVRVEAAQRSTLNKLFKMSVLASERPALTIPSVWDVMETLFFYPHTSAVFAF